MQTILATRKQFTHLRRNLNEDVEQINSDSGRYYKTPSGALYPSVTSVVGLMNQEAIMKWRARVGEEEANKIAQKASSRGTRIHQLCEDYLNNVDIDLKNYSYEDQINFSELKPFLHNIDNIHLQETRMYSDHLRMAGTVDCVAEWKGKLAIIDFKTAKKLKEKSYITNYFCQASAYAIMYEELFGIPVSRIVILISVDNEMPQVFEERRDNFVEPLLDIREKYKQKYGV
jgi:ATP-dependent exoDNAse (exonuclease V) beta subunit